MTRTSFTLLLALALTACSEDMPDTDAGTDAGEPTVDAGRDAGTDAGRILRDAGPTNCQEGCNWVELSLGVMFSCARRENGEVVCWGRDEEQQLGDLANQHDECGPNGIPDCSGPVFVQYQSGTSRPRLDDAQLISTRSWSTACALRENGELWCWGTETLAPGGGTPDQRPVAVWEQIISDSIGGATIVDAAVTQGHICYVYGAERQVGCFGDGAYGQLGNGLEPMTSPPVNVLDPSAGGTLSGVDQIGAAGVNTCARIGGELYCWGNNGSGQLGDGAQHTTCEPSGEAAADCSPSPVPVGGTGPAFDTVTDFSVGHGHVCAVTSDNVAHCWGENREAQLAAPVEDVVVDLPRAVENLTDIAQVAAGSSFTCARRLDGSVACWGIDLSGQLGDGDESTLETCERLGNPIGPCSRVPIETGIDDATFIAAGASHACAIRAGGAEIWCWGYNDQRQLGDGTRLTRYAPVQVVGLPE
jgi:alpha-tubulin suppressor-like RCC1 family protein